MPPPYCISVLVAQAKEGDRKAFGTLFEIYKGKVFSLCLRMTGNLADAEDLSQDAFIQALLSIRSFRGDASFSTWLHRVVVNTILIRRREKRLLEFSLDAPSTIDFHWTPRETGRNDMCLMGAVDRVALISAIQELSPSCRSMLILHDIDGYKHHEISKLLQCSVGNSKSQLHKARSQMRSLLG